VEREAWSVRRGTLPEGTVARSAASNAVVGEDSVGMGASRRLGMLWPWLLSWRQLVDSSAGQDLRPSNKKVWLEDSSSVQARQEGTVRRMMELGRRQVGITLSDVLMVPCTSRNRQ
jgi:hypothetical protein